MTSSNTPYGISLLWPDVFERRTAANEETYYTADLNLDPLVDMLSIEGRFRQSIQHLLARPVADPAVLNYRLDVIEDLLRSPDLVTTLEEALALITSLESYMVQPQWEQSELRKVAWRLSELENYVHCVEHLYIALTHCGGALRSAALCALRDMVTEIVQEPDFHALKAELPAMLDQIRGIKSITIGVNLDSQLPPMEATLLSVNTTRFTGEVLSFFNRLLGINSETPRHSNEGVGPLHKAKSRSTSMGEYNVRLPQTDNPLMHPLFKDLADVMDQICQPIAGALRKFVRVNGRLLVALQDEIAFYLGAVRLMRHLTECGLPMCRPQIAPQNERVCHLTGAYNVNLALRMAPLYRARDLRHDIITNDVHFGDEGRIFILTGPNRGGKTTYTQALGLCHILMQAGLFVPAVSASMSPVDGIFTHFAAEERLDLETGRLGEEARRLSEIFAHATRHSLILFNESLASTSAGESLYLARDIVRVVRLLGARAVFATHLHELAADADEINAETEGDSKVVSLVSMVMIEKAEDGESARRTYKIVPSAPMGRSYAREIALRYGISFDQLKSSLQARSQIPPDVNGSHPAPEEEHLSAD
jgi:DNA mismatch repair protein MutS